MQQKRIPQSGDRSKPFLWRLWRRRLTHSCLDAILMCLSNASDFVNDTLAKPCKKHCPSRLFKFCCCCCDGALTRILQYLLRCFLSNLKNLERIIIFKVERLSCSEFRMQPPPFRSLSDRCQPAGFTTHLHIESKSSDSVQVVDRKMGLKAAHVSQKLIWSL